MLAEFTKISDWDDAYANRDHIKNADLYYERWETMPPAFLADWTEQGGKAELDIEYGSHEREKLDLLIPAESVKGLFMFVHGGFWMALDKSKWTHLAKGALDRGWAVALPSYTLCPENRISAITRQIGSAVAVAARKIDGPIILSGHSAGGHLVSRMGCVNAPVDAAFQKRIKRIVSISGLHDLRPLLNLAMNQTWNLDLEEAMEESAALHEPIDDLELMCVVGGDERPEFVRQNALLANIWQGLGAATQEVVVPDRHHFDVIDELHHPEYGWLDEALKL